MSVTTLTPNADASYRDYAERQIRRHFLLVDGKADSDEVEDIEEQLAVLWEALDDTQRRSLNGMASDLNWLRRRGSAPPKGRTESAVTATELDALRAAHDAGDWHASLHYLRVCGPKLPPEVLAYDRATCYYHLGFPRLAAALFDLASELSQGAGAAKPPTPSANIERIEPTSS